MRDDLRVSNIGIFIQERFRRQNHSRSAESALKREVIEKRLLQRMQASRFVGQTFNRGDSLATNFVGEKRAGAHGQLSHLTRATPAQLVLAGYFPSCKAAAASQD